MSGERVALLLAVAMLGGGCGGEGELADKPGPLVTDTWFRRDSGHFMQGVVAGDSFLVGVSFNGLAAFDRESWKPQVFDGPHCARLAVAGERVYCTHHERELQVIGWSASGHNVTGITPIQVAAPASLEGLTVWRDALYVAGRRGGLLRGKLDGTGLAALPLPRGSGEPWDVAPLDDGTLVVAMGASGLLVLDFTADPDQPVVAAALPLPGFALAVNVTGRTAYVATLSGGGHAIDLADARHPRVSGTIRSGGLVYDIRAVGPLVVASAGFHQISARWIDGALHVVGVRPTISMALATADGAADGGPPMLYSTEFGIAGRYRIDDSFSPGPYLRIPRGTNAPGRGSTTLTLPIENVGDAPLAVRGVGLRLMGSSDDKATAPGFEVPAGGAHFIELPADAADYMLVVDAPESLASQSHIDIKRTSGLQVGDMLPGPIAYQDRDRHLHDVLASFQGKVGFLMIAASSCAVAYYTLHAARADLAPLVDAGAISAFSIDPWDNTDHGDMTGLDDVFPHLLSPLTTADSHDYSDVLSTFGQDGFTGPPMPIVYVVGRDGRIRFAQWGYETIAIKRAIAAALAEEP